MKNFIIISLLVIALSILSYFAYKSKNTYDFGITKIIMTIVNIGFIIGLTAYIIKPRLDIIFFWSSLPIVLFFVRVGADIPIVIKSFIVAAMIFWFYSLYFS